jgi:adenine-specific DNA-methyltransferase
MNGTRIKALKEIATGGVDSLLSSIEASRKEASLRLDPRRRVQMGQFLTPGPVATFMAGMFDCKKPLVRILDPGAGTGSLSAALVLSMCQRLHPPTAIALTAYEIDPLLVSYLRETLDRCRAACEETGISFEERLVPHDFLEAGASTFAGDLFATGESERFDCAILNPPYRKIRTESRERALLRSIGLETTNLYAGFLAVTARLLAPHGEMVAITPRSFCNGPYFEPFRRFILRELRFRRVHVFDARDSAFADDKVLQENVVFRAVKTEEVDCDVVVSASTGPGEGRLRMRTLKHDELVQPHDRHAFIHIVPDEDGEFIRHRIGSLDANLSDLGLTVSTGRVVDFRAKELLRAQPGRNTVPLIYPCHLRNGFVEWPNGKTRKPNALALLPGAEELLLPSGYYVLTKRFSAKEERRRVVAAVYDPTRVSTTQVGFENHLNYYHAQGSGLPVTVAKGLATFLNSTLVDTYFRQFSGHTQVNASDLRSLHYPAWTTLVALGRRIGKSFPPQEELDHVVEEVLFRG